MAIELSVTKASGQGTCKRCRNIIKKGTLQIVAKGYRDSSRTCFDCLRIMVHLAREDKLISGGMKNG